MKRDEQQQPKYVMVSSVMNMLIITEKISVCYSRTRMNNMLCVHIIIFTYVCVERYATAMNMSDNTRTHFSVLFYLSFYISSL